MHPQPCRHVSARADPRAFRQQSEATFLIADAVEHPSPFHVANPSVFDSDAQNLDGIMNHVFEVCLKVYVEDVKSLVAKAVSAETERLEDGRDFAARDAARTRRVALRAWLASKHPLSYEKDDFPSLLAAIAPLRNDTNGVAFSLEAPPGEGRPMSFFVNKVVDGARKRREPPFLQDGMFQPTVVAALDAVGDIARRRYYWSDVVVDDNFFKRVLARVASKLKINHVPWTRNVPEQRGPGRLPTQIVHNVWLPLGAAEPRQIEPGHATLTPSQSRDAAILVSSDTIALGDPRASWSACRHRLSNYHKVLGKRCLPSEWSIEQASIQSKDAFCLEVYTWVRDNYDPTRPLHAIATFLSLVFAGMLPHAFPPRSFDAPKKCSMTELANYIADLPWEERSEKKGASLVPPFITMVSTFIIGVMDERSPLAAGLADLHFKHITSERRSEVKSFVDKHSESSTSSDVP